MSESGKSNSRMNTRREFLSKTALTVFLPQTALKTSPSQPKETVLPEGVIAPYQWNAKVIRVSGRGTEQTQTIDEAVTAVMRQYGIVGCGVSIVQGNRVIYSKGFGYAELNKIPFLPTTTTRCGSLAKPITALSALLLFDQGKLKLDETVLPILEEAGIVPTPLGGSLRDSRVSQITVRHLMDHTSGLPNGATYTAWRPNRNVAALHRLDHTATASDVVRDALGNMPLESEPGTKYQYANANFVILARVIEARSKMPFSEFLTTITAPKFGLTSDEVFVSKNQDSAGSKSRGLSEAAYYQTSEERYVSFVPSEQSRGRIYGEAYHGYSTESSDGAGGIACSALALGKIIANLHSSKPALSASAIRQILTPPSHYLKQPEFNPAQSGFYSKGFDVRFSGGLPWVSHGGMTNHCGGVIGHNAGYQFVAVSNWNNTQSPFVDSILNKALTEAVTTLRA